VADLQALKDLHAWMTANSVPYAKCGDLELRLLPPASTPVPLVETPLSPAEERRRSIESLLWSSGADPTPFLGVDR
jgi:hypothetical protein